MSKVLDVLTTLAALVAVALAAGAFVRSGAPQYPGDVPDVRAVSDWREFGAAGRILEEGAEDVVVVIFGDYECPACRGVEPWVKAARARFRGQAKFVYRHFPLTYHTAARPAAEAAECAGLQGRFMQFHDLLLSESGWLIDPQAAFPVFAVRAGVPDPDAFSRCLMAGTGTPQVLADMDAGAKLGVRGTPSLLVNGSLLPGVPDSTYLMDHIEAAIRETAR